jgi:RNA polymerase sigma-70 factor, ECF subfamily
VVNYQPKDFSLFALHSIMTDIFTGGKSWYDREKGDDMAISSDSNSVSSTLLDQLRAGRPEAWERFVRLYSPVIYRWCRRSGLTAEDSADVFQEVFSAVMLNLSDFHRDKVQDSFGAWLAAITRNKVCDLYRRRHGMAEARGGSTAQCQMAEVPQPPEPSEEFIRPDAESAAWLSRRALDLIRAEFEYRTWEAFWRVTIQGQPSSQVAEDLKMSIPAVYTAKSRVLRRLRQIMSEMPQ